MPAIEYPAALPMPAVADLERTERRSLSSLPGPRASRVRQRDFGAVQRIEWAILNRAQLSQLRAWWHDDLIEGGAWFAARWPLPRGLVVAVRKFLTELTLTHLGNGKWRVSALCEVRGSGLLPQSPGVAAVEIGWTNPIGSWSEATILHSNSGTAVAFGGYGIGSHIYAGLVVDDGQTVEWFADWYPTAGGPAPVLNWESGLRILDIEWFTQTEPAGDDPFLFNPARGELVVTATIDGVPIAVGQRLIAVVSSGVDYPEIAWGPEP